MPVRFRCAYCNQLMAIATRKVGTVVRCPKCAGEVIVPTPADYDPSAAEPEQTRDETAPSAVNVALEDPEFDKYFDAAVASDGPARAPVRPPTKPPSTPAPTVAPTPSTGDISRTGWFVPTWLALVGALLALGVIAAAFFLGYKLGQGS